MFGWVTLKEKGYLPLEGIISGTIKKRADRYFISVSTEENPIVFQNNSGEGIGIDLGVKEFMTCSNGFVFPNINKSIEIIKLEKKLKREQRALSRKYEAHKKNKELTYKNLEKNKLRIQKLNYKLECKRNDYINKCIEVIVEQKPKFISLENLNIKGMRKNRHLAKALSDSKFYYTKQKIIEKAKKNGIEVREVDRFYPSSKACSRCGKLKKDLKLKDRIYKCSCGLEIDRDLNAAFNLKKAKEYKVLTEATDGLSGSNACGLYNNLSVPFRESMQDEARKSQLMLKKKIFDKQRSILYNKYVSIL
jgi:putative transposase